MLPHQPLSPTEVALNANWSLGWISPKNKSLFFEGNNFPIPSGLAHVCSLFRLSYNCSQQHNLQRQNTVRAEDTIFDNMPLFHAGPCVLEN
jgi:hypothetical protein